MKEYSLHGHSVGSKELGAAGPFHSVDSAGQSVRHSEPAFVVEVEQPVLEPVTAVEVEQPVLERVSPGEVERPALE